MALLDAGVEHGDVHIEQRIGTVDWADGRGIGAHPGHTGRRHLGFGRDLGRKIGPDADDAWIVQQGRPLAGAQLGRETAQHVGEDMAGTDTQLSPGRLEEARHVAGGPELDDPALCSPGGCGRSRDWRGQAQERQDQ
jgi:hypothetical protein